jgi:cystathionine beta-lyase/cystathionine gamma-synthase
MSASQNQGFNTRAVHAGQDFEPRTGAVIPPLHFATTYARTASAGSATAMNTAAAETPPATPCRNSSPHWKAEPTPTASVPAWQRRTPSSGR